MPARAVLLNPGNHELFGWTDLMGLAVEAHPDVPPKRFRIDCSGSAFGIEEQLEQVVIAPVETEPVVMPVPGPGLPSDLQQELIEFRFWRECPSHQRALERLLAVMDELGVARESLDIREVETEAEAEESGFLGSPSILVNGADLQPDDGEIGLNCRIYRQRDGGISALPDIEDIRDALRPLAAGKEQI